MYKVHWIIDGIANVNEKTQEDAENVINSKIQNIQKFWINTKNAQKMQKIQKVLN